MKRHFPKGRYADVLGLCKAASTSEIEEQGWSLNPGRYVGVAEREEDDFDFATRLKELNDELEKLNREAHELEVKIGENAKVLLRKRQGVGQ
jgi:type I restriction enzyme M protein